MAGVAMTHVLNLLTGPPGKDQRGLLGKIEIDKTQYPRHAETACNKVG
jgi:hypothetical protein